MTPQIQSLLSRRQVARSIIISIIEINAEKQLESTLDNFWTDLDLIDKALRELMAKDLSLQEIKTGTFLKLNNNETN